MHLPWFKRKGLFFMPITVAGWIIFLAAIAYVVYVFRDIDSRSHSASDTLRNFVFNLIVIGVVYTLIAFLTNRNPNPKD